ncbi:sulfotransferase domain-containing protein [Magnetovibrio sp.]|uniref:sulfotransferase domain-containing protein n=1 Tax=Magnetovibrio sp. TaxID=2024836 RepID=UPI002F936453
MNNEDAMHIPKVVRRLFPKLSADCDALVAREQTLNERLAGLSQQLQALDAQNQTLDAQRLALEEKSDSLEGELAALREIEQKVQQIDTQNAALQESVEAADRIISEQHALRTDLEARYEALRAEADAAIEERDAAYQKLEEDFKKLQTVSGELEAATKSLADVTQERDAMIHAVQISDAKYDALVARWDAYRLPSVVITTMPKSGTYYISNYLSKGLHCETRVISNQYFPYDTIRYSEIKEASLGSYITQDHFPATPPNTHFISQFFDRVVCHLRDPRQAMLSYVHYLDRFKGGDDTFSLIYPRLSDDFFEWPIEKRLDWGIDQWLPLLVEWTEQWVAFADGQKDVNVKFTRFEDLVSDEEAFTQEILDFYGIPAQRFIPPVLKKDSDVHFRAGLIDEWRTALTPEQQERATAQISPQIAKRFDWSLEL